MGYVIEETVYHLVFDGKHEGLEVKVREGSVGDYLAISELSTHPFATPPTADDIERLRALFVALAGVLVSWNVEMNKATSDAAGHRVTVPATAAGVASLPPLLAVDIATAWMQAVAGVSPPLPEASNAGEMEFDVELERSLKMETLSSSLLS